MAEPRLAYGMLGAAADDPRDRAALQGKRPALADILATPQLRQALANPRVDRSGDVKEGAGAEAGGVTAVDKDVPRQAKVGGKTFDPAQFVSVHEQVEEAAMRRLTAAGMPVKQAYDVAHNEYALPAERAAVEKAGIPWQGYEDKWRGYLSSSEHEKAALQNPRIDPGQAQAAGGKGPIPPEEASGPSPDLAYGMLSNAADDPRDRAALRRREMEAYQRAAPDLGPSASGRADPVGTDEDYVKFMVPGSWAGRAAAGAHTTFGALRGLLGSRNLEAAPQRDPSEAEREAQMAQEARDVAARRTSESARPSRGRAYTPQTEAMLQSIVPTTPTDIGLTLALGPAGRVLGPLGRVGMAAGGMLMDPTEAQAGAAGTVRKAVSGIAPAVRRAAEAVVPAAQRGLEAARQYLIDPVAARHPGIYKDPRELATEAEATVAPEHPALKMLFGVNRQDLYDISQGGTRAGNVDPRTLLNRPANPKGSYTSENIMTPANERRMVDAIAETRTSAPELRRGMIPWYVMDPAYQRLEQISGDPQRLYSRFNTLGSMASPMSDVMTEIRRGTAANQMAELGRFPEFERYGGIAADRRFRFRGFPEELEDVPGHTAHSTSQAPSMARYLETGNVEMQSPKVPLYIGASGVPQTGFQTALPVPDAHFTRAVGMADVRRTADPSVSMKMPEYNQTGPWFREQVARPSGLEAVPAQALTWGLYSGQTGVDTLIGAPKLELLAKSIYERAMRLGIDPYMLRDKVLLGQEHAELEPGSGPGTSTA